ncbi:hypothetical protein GIB67_029694 [Kingdonia uniflora]|uniref:Gamma tubulin complex component C-terminal domain-containing protein n=1 Tax=Kingdonia uniflora TaxID=39325 RepID=A0A7J7LLI1_9MAGN|nr:hypothetical protein GIB67_029694 [Kingdonia uniflora]
MQEGLELLSGTWLSIFGGMEGRGTSTINLKHHWLVEQKLLHFVDAFHQYVMDRVFHSSWLELCEGMASAGSLDEVIEAHETYLLSIQRQCFVVPDKLWALIASRIKNILGLALDFYSVQQTLISGGTALAIKARCEKEIDRIEKQFDDCIAFLLRGGFYDHAFSFYSNGFGKGVGFSPIYFTLNLVIKAGDIAYRITPKALDVADTVYALLNVEGCSPNPVTFNVLINGLYKSGDMIRASKLVDMFLKGKAIFCWKDMEKKGCIPNEVCYSVLVNSLCKDGKLKEKLMVWKHMLGRGCKPDVVAYSLMIHDMCNIGLVDDGLRLFNKMLCQDLLNQM